MEPVTTEVTAAPAPPPPAPPRRRSPLRRLLGLLVGVAAVVVAAWWLYPRARVAMTTVSTDDAYVGSHVTYLAPRVTENVVQVRADDNDFVRKGEVVVVLDDTMLKVRVAQAEAALEAARRGEDVAQAKTRATISGAKANRFKLASAISEVRNQAAGLRVAVARLKEARAAESLATKEAQRYETLAQRGSVTREQADVRRTESTQAHARAEQALEDVHRIRVGLELPEEPADGKPLDDVPDDLAQRHSSVLAALGALALNLSEVGVRLPGYYSTPDEFIAQIKKDAPNGDIDALIETTVARAPGVEAARAQTKQAEEALAQARLELSYTKVVADIDGFVSNRNVNPGDRVVQGQRLMAIRSFEEIWVDANFKETQLEPIRIGHPVDLSLDAYPGVVFRGRVSGFSPGTGASTALFPAQNATGNFVKIVQRLPVRIELVGGNRRETPLFVGLSAVPYIRVYEQPTGPNAGARLRLGPEVTRPPGASPPPRPTAASEAPAGSAARP